MSCMWHHRNDKSMFVKLVLRVKFNKFVAPCRKHNDYWICNTCEIPLFINGGKTAQLFTSYITPIQTQLISSRTSTQRHELAYNLLLQRFPPDLTRIVIGYLLRSYKFTSVSNALSLPIYTRFDHDITIDPGTLPPLYPDPHSYKYEEVFE
jgi:hypothetical protein